MTIKSEEKILGLDTRGMICPMPLIQTKKAIKSFQDKREKGEVVVIVDNQTAKENIERFLADNNHQFSSEKEDGHFKINISVDVNLDMSMNTKNIYSVKTQDVVSSAERRIVVISSDAMGQGELDLGRVLLQGFINTLGEIEELYHKIIFYNSAVNLAVQDSPVAKTLTHLIEKGSDIVVCGTCVDYFGIDKKLICGRITNMYEIVKIFNEADRVIRP